WMNGMYIRALPVEELAERVRPFLEAEVGPVDRDYLLRIVPLIQERIKLLPEAVQMAGFFFQEGDLKYPLADLLGKRFAGDPASAADALEAVLSAIDGLEPWQHDGLEGAIRPLAQELGYKTGELFGLVRVAVTGTKAAPPLFESMAVLGRERTVQRLEAARRRLR
ncbi:MAG: glutamate--tRNA ligase, partial [Dehalococcoidia bacterium]